jgi:hypothetical protein
MLCIIECVILSTHPDSLNPDVIIIYYSFIIFTLFTSFPASTLKM